jgi:quinol monooxygenase YgiN
MKANTGSYDIEESIAEDGCHKYRLRFTNQQKQVIRR